MATLTNKGKKRLVWNWKAGRVGFLQNPIQRTVITLIDFSRAYDGVRRDALLLKMAKKTLSERLVGGMTGMGKKKRGESDHGDHDLAFLELSRCNSYDFEVNTRDSDTVCGFARVERHLVPVEAVQAGVSSSKPTAKFRSRVPSPPKAEPAA